MARNTIAAVIACLYVAASAWLVKRHGPGTSKQFAAGGPCGRLGYGYAHRACGIQQQSKPS